MRIIYSLFFLVFVSVAHAQTDSLQTIAADTGNSRDSVGAFQKVEVEAGFPGGIEAWRIFLQKNLKADAPLKDLPRRVKYFEQTVLVKFIVCKDGTLCDVQAVNDVLPSIKKEAERVIKKSGVWTPGYQNGKPVKSYHTQPITFVVTSE